jgi:hypothetical protein
MPEQVFVFARAVGEIIETASVYSIVVITPSSQR